MPLTHITFKINTRGSAIQDKPVKKRKMFVVVTMSAGTRDPRKFKLSIRTSVTSIVGWVILFVGVHYDDNFLTVVHAVFESSQALFGIVAMTIGGLSREQGGAVREIIDGRTRCLG